MATDSSTTNFVPAGFRSIERLGIGTVFEVARVHDARDRELICKRAVNPRFAAALARERDLLQAVRLAALPELVAAGSDARGGFLVETRARGAPVRTLMDGRTPPGAAQWLELARASTEALAALHTLGDDRGELHIVHGDISPDNLFFETPGIVTFVDFSSATWREGPEPALPGDRGTVPYAAPELVRQESRATAAMDTYALAATLLAVAVGPPIVRASSEAGRLYEAASEGVLWKRIEERTDLPVEARSALAEALQYEQGSRLASSTELAARLAPLSGLGTLRRE